ncbi:hypothetical protein FH972_014530 [Carpinus fangiana]|uniref:Uncharacterized protein n=1 Tax=Carpinus fangiana TaxID=176857 RepID=A0A5N6RA32_9ROSI|nr:hypothetical protein FH972_014530 [Carpinus fangiana]
MSLRYLSRIGVRLVEGLKDQGSKGFTRPPQSKFRSDSDNSSQVRRFSGTLEPMKKVNMARRRRLRRAEKAENVVHLICWGPK